MLAYIWGPKIPLSKSRRRLNRVLLHDPVRERWLRFSQPLEIAAAFAIDEVVDVVERVERAVAGPDGLWAAGYIAYEAAPAFDAAMQTNPPAEDTPLVWFGLYNAPHVAPAPPLGAGACDLGLWRPLVSSDAYRRAIGDIKKYIRAGDTYQVNFTFPLEADFTGDPERLLLQLLRSQPGGYAALVETVDHAIVSVSPELFFRLDGDTLTCRPMKGTRRRGVTRAHTQTLADELRASEKDCAENVMIVDMIRNDMGRVAEPGSVNVPRLFEVEQYPTVLQMTSTVTGKTSAAWSAVLAALFPCASITGAPKVRTMDLIAELESGPRGVYTGGIGFLAPHRNSQFSVAIRTVQLSRAATGAHAADAATPWIARYDVGGGIVWDSDASAEYEECRTKAAVLLTQPADFSLLETMRFEPNSGVVFLDEHLDRLTESAAYFGSSIDEDAIRRQLVAFSSFETTRLRLLVDKSGSTELQATPMAPQSGDAVQLAIALEPVNPHDPFLYHKTTLRTAYEQAAEPFQEARDVDDVVLHTPDGFVTETCKANIAIRNPSGHLVTPPTESGLLAGVLRSHLLRRGDIVEGAVTLFELLQADEIYVFSALRGLRRGVVTRRLPRLSPRPEISVGPHA